MPANIRTCSPDIRYVRKRTGREVPCINFLSLNVLIFLDTQKQQLSRQLYDEREIGDRNELVLFSSPGDQSELDAVFESVYKEASKLFTNNRTKDQAVILAAFLQKLCYYPV